MRRFSRPTGSVRPRLRSSECREPRLLAQRQRPAGPVAELALGRARLRLAFHAEDAGHDHVERDRLHALRQPEGVPFLPAVELPVDGGLDHRLVLLDRVTVERGQQQAALAHVTRAVGGEDTLAEDRPQGGLGGDRGDQLLLGGEERLGVVGMARDDEMAVLDRHVEREDVAVLAPGLGEEGQRTTEEPGQLDGRRQVDHRRRGQRHAVDGARRRRRERADERVVGG